MTQSLGSWDLVTEDSEVLAVHAALLPSGKVLFFSGSEHDEAPPDPASRINATRLWDPADNRVRLAGGPLPDDLFCSGHCLLPTGDVFVAGGTEHYEVDAHPQHAAFEHFTGISSAIVFSWRDERWRPARPMAGGRWYPTCLTVADGRVLVLSGHGSDLGLHDGMLIEMFNPTDGTWSAPFATIPPLEDTGGLTVILGKQIRPMVYYPRLHQLPNGTIFSSTPLRVNDHRRTRAIELAGRSCNDLGDAPLLGTETIWPGNIYGRSAFPSVLLPLEPPSYNTRILICGHYQPQFFEPNNAHLGWRDAGNRNPDPIRAYANAVLLPDGTVLVVGGATSERLRPLFDGGRDDEAVHFAERYTPQTNSWDRLAESPNRIARVYHSVALLLPDGRVWIAGSNHDSDRNRGGVRKDDPKKGDARELRIETFSPPYLFTTDPATGEAVPAPRPQTGLLLSGAGHGQLFRVETPDAKTVRVVHLVRCGSATHAFNPDQRLVVLTIVRRDAGSITVRMPPNGAVAPPGYYLLFLLNLAGTPSVGRFVQVAGVYPIVEVYLGRPLSTIDIPDLPVGVDVTTTPVPIWDLGELRFGNSRRALVRCKNVGTGPLRLFDPQFTGDFRTEATPDSPILGTRGLPKNLDATIRGAGAQEGDFVELELVFRPTEMGLHVGTLSVNTNAADLGAFFIDLRVNVVGFEVELLPAASSSNEVRFGDVAVGTTAVRGVTVRNRGTIDGYIVDLTIDDGASTPFSAPPFLPEARVPAGQTREISVRFTPTVLGSAHATLTVIAESTPAPASFTGRPTIELKGIGTGPRISLAPTDINYDPQLIRTQSQPRTVTITNSGSGPLRITNIMVSSDWTVAAQPPTSEIAPGGTFDVTVVFRPGHTGPLTGTLIVDGNAPDGAATATLHGTGVAAPIAGLVPTALSFGDQPIGTHGLDRRATIFNDGAADLQVFSVGLVGAHGGDFRITADNAAGATLGPEEAGTVDVLFTPSGSGPRTAALEFVDDAGGSPRTISLAGAGTTPPACTTDPTALRFDGQRLGNRSDPQVVTITNNGQTPLTIAHLENTGPAAAEFTFRHNCTSDALPSGSSCTVEVTFQPTQVGSREADLIVTHDGAGPAIAISLAGVGIGAAITFEPPDLVFPPEPVGTFSTRQDVLLNNVGNSELTIASLLVTGDFRYDHSCGDIIGPGGFCRIRVIFQPAATGTRSGEILVSDALGNQFTVPLSGTGVAPQAALSTASLTFGDQAITTKSAPQTVRLTNTGTGPLIVSSVQVTDGITADEFITDIKECVGAVLYQGESCNAKIAFAPRALGQHATTLNISTNASDSPHTVTLSGNGIASEG